MAIVFVLKSIYAIKSYPWSCILTVKSKKHIDCQHKHEENVGEYVGVVDVSPKKVPFVVDEGGNQRVFEQLLAIVDHLHVKKRRRIDFLCLYLHIKSNSCKPKLKIS